jgi:hypothetical protein
VARAPREIHVRLATPSVPAEKHDVWVVNGRVIRFLDPMQPEDLTLPPQPTRRFGRLRALAHR